MTNPEPRDPNDSDREGTWVDEDEPPARSSATPPSGNPWDVPDAPPADAALLRLLASWCRQFGKGIAFLAPPRIEKLAAHMEVVAPVDGECPDCGAFVRLLPIPDAHFCASSPPPPSTPLTEEELKSAILDTPFTFDPKRGLPRPSEGFVRDAAPATPSSPETPAAKHEWLDDAELATIEEETRAFIHDGATPPDATDLCFAVLELRLLYNRQREEIEDEKAISKRQGEAIAELCREIERLKASQLTAEDARYCLDNPPYHGFKHELYAKLVRLRSSQSGGTTDV